jgi:hypothetical protein
LRGPGDERKYKLVVTGISADQRAKLFAKKAMLKEDLLILKDTKCLDEQE